MNWKEYLAITGYTLLVILATVFSVKASAGIIMQYTNQDGREIDVYVNPEQRKLMLVDRYKQQVIYQDVYHKAQIMKDEALNFYCSVKQPSFSDVFLCD